MAWHLQQEIWGQLQPAHGQFQVPFKAWKKGGIEKFYPDMLGQSNKGGAWEPSSLGAVPRGGGVIFASTAHQLHIQILFAPLAGMIWDA